TRCRGVGSLRMQANAEVVLNTGKAAERARWTAELVDEGHLLPVRVEGQRQPRSLLAEERPILDGTRERSSAPAAVTFMAPLDPLIWDRRLLRDLFGVDSIWGGYGAA